MKKIFLILAIAFGAFAMQSCNSCTKEANVSPEFLYNLTAQATGKVGFNWFNGGASIDGTATVFQSNAPDTLMAFGVNPKVEAIDLTSTLTANAVEPDVLRAAVETQHFIDGIINDVNGFSGEWGVDLTGYVTYGKIVFAIDEHWPKSDADPIVVVMK